ESRILAVQELVVSKRTPKLRPSTLDPKLPAMDQSTLTRDQLTVMKNGCAQVGVPVIGMFMTKDGAGTHLCVSGNRQTMPQLANYLSREARTPVIDKTGLGGAYDFAARIDPRAGGFREALEPELGLKLR